MTTPAAEYHFADVLDASGAGATIKTEGRTVLVPWQAMRTAANQDASDHGRPVDDVTRELARRYRILMAIAYPIWRKRAAACGRLLEIRKFEVGCRFATCWGLAKPGQKTTLLRTVDEPFGMATGVHVLTEWADIHGYAI